MKSACQRFILLLLFASLGSATQAMSVTEVRQLVVKFYNCFLTIVNGEYPGGEPTDQSATAKQDGIDFCNDTEVDLPNEFPFFGFSNSYGNSLRPATYLTLLTNMAIKLQHKMRMTVDVGQPQPLVEIKMNKSEADNFYKVLVKKTISNGMGKSDSYEDVVKVSTEVGKIIGISNKTGGDGANTETIESLRFNAAELYTNKQYQEAYDAYLKIVQADAKQGDAYYRLALMTYHNKGCKKRYPSGKTRRAKALEFAEKARSYARYPIRDYSQNLIYMMTQSISY